MWTRICGTEEFGISVVVWVHNVSLIAVYVRFHFYFR